jgi:hypothetical protein
MASLQLNAQMFAMLPPLFTLLAVYAIECFLKADVVAGKKSPG